MHAIDTWNRVHHAVQASNTDYGKLLGLQATDGSTMS